MTKRKKLTVAMIVFILILLSTGITVYAVNDNFRGEVIAFCNRYMISNNKKLENLEKELKKIEPPSDTKIIESQSILGKLNGNGNGMSYLVTSLIKSEKTLDELEEYYNKYNINVQEQTTTEFINKYLEHGSIEYKSMKEYFVLSNDYYVVYIYESKNEDSLFDFRGH